MRRDGEEAMDVLATLRASFARAFAEPPMPEPACEDLVTIGVGGGRFALRVAELRALERRRAIVPLPTGLPGSLGLTTLRGRVVPVYDLGAIVGHPGGEVAWLAFVERPEAVALGFASFDGFARVPCEAFTRDTSQARPVVPELVRLDAVTRGVLDLRAAVNWISLRAGEARARKER